MGGAFECLCLVSGSSSTRLKIALGKSLYTETGMAKETEQEIGAPAKPCESAVRLLADLRLSLSVSKPDRSAPYFSILKSFSPVGPKAST
jgi:hypothetical protein